MINRNVQIWLTLAVISISSTKEIYYEFSISYFEGAPDGVPVKILGVNNQFPGPTIRATKYDILTIKVTNQIQDHQSTTIHWHGIEQYLNPFEDGPRMITQCDIPFNSSFIYRFQVIQSGTYWYHSHHTLQMSEGLWGAMIIDNTPEVYNYDGEIFIAATPWYHTSGKDQLEWYMDMEKSKGELPVPDSNLLNGVGYYPCEYAHRKNVTCDPTLKDRYVVFEVERGKTYRFRYFNTAPLTGYQLTIDEHKIFFIESDGVDTVMSAPRDAVVASTGGRLSFLVTMDGDKDQYWMRFVALFDSIKPNGRPNINPFPEVFFEPTYPLLAVLKYKEPTNPSRAMKKQRTNPNAVQGRPAMHDRDSLLNMQKNSQAELNFDLLNKDVVNGLEEFGDEDPMKPIFTQAPFPTTIGVSVPDVIKFLQDVVPIGGEAPPNYVNQTIIINVTNVDDPNSPHHRGGFNNITFDTSTLDKPALFSALLGEKLPKSLNPIVIEGFGSDYVVEIIFNDFGDTGHPIHLHGYTFWVVGGGRRHAGPFIEEIHRQTLSPRARLETFSCLVSSWLVIRFRADNPGVWFMHCHIAHHLEAAMGLVLEVGLEEAKKVLKIPQKSVELCKRNGIDLDYIGSSNVPSISMKSSVLVALALLLSTRSLSN